MKKIRLVKDWDKKDCKCRMCGTDKSVKYEVEAVRGSDQWFPLCNKCAHMFGVD